MRSSESPLRPLVVGIGGGGDVAGALAIARTLRPDGSFEIGGVSWERFSIDPHPGPRALEELSGIERLGDSRAALCRPDGATPEGVRLCEAGAAQHLGRPTVLVDVTAGPRAAAEGIAAACERLACDGVVLLDIGGDVLADGSEPGLSSPLCDAVMLAAALHLPAELPVTGCVFGAGCDGELTPAEVLGRVAVLGRLGIWLGSASPPADIARELVALAEVVPTEASLMAARCALGEVGPAEIRNGRRSVELGPVGGVAFSYDARAAVGEAAPLAALVTECDSIESARGALAAAGVRTELDIELEWSRAARG